jgi:hypothetical protein
MQTGETLTGGNGLDRERHFAHTGRSHEIRVHPPLGNPYFIGTSLIQNVNRSVRAEKRNRITGRRIQEHVIIIEDLLKGGTRN